MSPRTSLSALIVSLCAAAVSSAQEELPTAGDQPVGTTIVTALRGESSELGTPWSVETIDSEQILERSYRTTPQALRDQPGVMIQETSPGQGSPFLRGFTGFRTLFLIDGVRLNNSTFREGPNQYWNTVDPYSLERYEVVLGPSSVLWGSDAIGGAVNALTKLPWTYQTGTGLGARTIYRVASAESSHIARLEGSTTSNERIGVLLGVTGKTFGDLSGGHDIGTQQETGYDELDGDLKVEYFLDPDTRLVVLHQEVHQNDVPRTHATIFANSFEGTTVGTDIRRDLDQERRLSYVQLHAENQPAFFDRASFNLSWHEQNELQDRVRGNGTRDLQGTDVGTLGLFGHLSSPTDFGRFTYGADFYRDGVDSFLDRGAAQTPADEIQGPVGDDAVYDLFGLYVQDEIQVAERWDLVLGSRFDWARADVDSVRDPVTNTEFAIEDDWSSLVGSARVSYSATQAVSLFGGVSQGFRAPNLSDLTRFDNARTNEFEIPTPNLDPEHYLSFEIGAKREDELTRARASTFYTVISDQIVRFPTGNVNANGDFEITRDNVGDGYVWGIELAAERELARQWTVFGHATFLDGEVSTFPTSAPIEADEPIDRLMPLTARLGLRWQHAPRGPWSEAVGTWAGDADELSTRDKSDTQRIPPGGTPSWATLDLRAGLPVGEHVAVVAALENVFDEDYRVHGSGTNSPGLNAVLTLSAEF